MIHADLIIPPIIIGLIIILIFRVNSFIMESSADNRLYTDVQTFAEVAATVIQEELRTLDHFVQVQQDSIRYVTTLRDTVSMTRNGRNIEIIRYDMINAGYDSVMVPASLSGIQFTLEPQAAAVPTFLRVRVETESEPGQHVRFRNDVQTVRAFSERRFFLRNIAVSANSN
ncbi:MAG: hypothetical protein EA359_17630 [Balneolaceae bacterium]|nr:MAG: hypothetical protein EA359_17630 [Balneolaceae bacterium]